MKVLSPVIYRELIRCDYLKGLIYKAESVLISGTCKIQGIGVSIRHDGNYSNNLTQPTNQDALDYVNQVFWTTAQNTLTLVRAWKAKPPIKDNTFDY